MTVQTETSLRINFAKGYKITPVLVYDEVEIPSKTFNNKDHQIEELIDFIHYNENGDIDVYL
jgi:hypothetical protein|tara:strand:+ start:1063 stop:1248 length:186 start_codon:yes stop_codon:yes gene_type:complete